VAKKKSAEKTSDKKTLEELISRLEEISATIQEGDVSLEESIELYAEGQSIAKECSERLSAAQKKLQIINPNLIDAKSDDDNADDDKAPSTEGDSDDDDFNDTLPDRNSNGLFA
jgi:exodeoxyribonuclease VII small subunit